MKDIHHVALSVTVGLVCLVLYDACSTGYPLKHGLPHGVFFGVPVAFAIIGIALLIGMIIADLLERFVSLPKFLERLIRYYLHVPLSLLFLFNGYKKYLDDGFEHYVSETRPTSLKVEKRELVSGFGHRYWMFALSVDPAEVGIITSELNYKVEDLSERNLQQRIDDELHGFHDLTIPEEYREATEVISYHKADEKSEFSTGYTQTLYFSPSTGRFLVFGSDD